jgi:hypothetical protein
MIAVAKYRSAAVSSTVSETVSAASAKVEKSNEKYLAVIAK